MPGLRKWAPLIVVVAIVIVGVVLALPGLRRSPAGPSETVAYPTKPITVIVGFGAGGMTDRTARGIQPILEEYLGQPLVVVNMPGASGAIGAAHVAQQPLDGYTVLLGSETMSLWRVMDISHLSYRSFEPIMLLTQGLPTITVNAASPWKTVQEFVADVRANPGKFKLGLAGPATTGAVAAGLLQKVQGTEFTRVTFEGGGPAVTACLGGHVDVVMENLPDVVGHHQAGKLRILAIFDNVRHPQLTDVPALGELFPELKPHLPYGPYWGLFVLRGTPPEVCEVLADAMSKAVNDPRWKQFVSESYFREIGLGGQAAVDFIEAWTGEVTWLLYDLGVAKKSPEEFGIVRP